MREIGEKKLEKIVRYLRTPPKDTVPGAVIWGVKFLYALDMGGSVIRRYQKRIAEHIGWDEKDLTLRNSIYCGIIPYAVIYLANDNLGHHLWQSVHQGFYRYPEFVIAQSVLRAAFSQITGKAIGAISLYNVLLTPLYAGKEGFGYMKKKLTKGKPAEGVEPSTPGLQNRCSDH